VETTSIYEDELSGKNDSRPGLDTCLKALRKGGILVVGKLDWLGRELEHLVNTVQDLSDRGIGVRVLAGRGAQVDTAKPTGKLIFGIFASLAEFERELIRERTMAGLAAARARGRKVGRKFAPTKVQVRLAQTAMADRDTRSPSSVKSLASAPSPSTFTWDSKANCAGTVSGRWPRKFWILNCVSI